MLSGRSERIRTSGPCVPNAVLYQAELHSDALLEAISDSSQQQRMTIVTELPDNLYPSGCESPLARAPLPVRPADGHDSARR